jgi:hypothetical protein
VPAVTREENIGFPVRASVEPASRFYWLLEKLSPLPYAQRPRPRYRPRPSLKSYRFETRVTLWFLRFYAGFMGNIGFNEASRKNKEKQYVVQRIVLRSL